MRDERIGLGEKHESEAAPSRAAGLLKLLRRAFAPRASVVLVMEPDGRMVRARWAGLGARPLRRPC